MAKFTHTYTGNSGYTFAFPDGPVVLNHGDKVTLTDDVAASVGDEFHPIGKPSPAVDSTPAGEPEGA